MAKPCYVYFIGGDDTPIKIGRSEVPEWRLNALQIGCWAELRVLAKIDERLLSERHFHQKHAAHHIRGEWFAKHPDILEDIERINANPVPFRRTSGKRAA